ncbi:hypothetical protein J2I47_21975 [Fibrella sp. HMF5335]|uniref:Protein argonaute n=1 Tax=Fibrella rubiginis TaxID=2817060 RepID=A0A939GHG2_9BACT|nr:Piwi domain-containing protein [Fibrella rubiginis]MBO0939237.1 hypothetical protein [Fibrella rubiginis]
MAITLNVAPISFNDASIDIEEFRYSEDRFNQLHNEYRKTHLIQRIEDRIQAIPIRKDAKTAGGRKGSLILSENLNVVASLANEALYRRLLERSCWITGKKPITYLVSGRNLIEDCLPEGTSLRKGLSMFARWEIDFRIQNPTGENPYVALSINVGTAPRISYSCDKLLQFGVPLTGYYVGRANLGRNPELKPRFTTVGKVTGIEDGDLLQLDDLRPGEDSPSLASKLYLEPREDVLAHCIKHIYGEHALGILERLDKRVSAFHTGPEKLKRLASALESFQAFSLELIEGIPFTIDQFLTNDINNDDLTTIGIADKPTFVFAYGGQKVSLYNDNGLQKYGPYSREGFSPSRPRICVICQASKKGQVEQIVKKFLDGIPPVEYAAGRSFEYTGLKAKYHLLGCHIEFFTTTDDSVEAYNRTTSDALRVHGTGQGAWNLALIQIDRSFRDRTDHNNPYLTTKARLIGQQVPVQEFTLEALGLPDKRVVWTLNNMSLATYAKLNGVPWLLKADRPIAHEVVFGIGSATIKEGRYGGGERMIGVTTVFTGDGNYFVSNVSSAVPEEDYFETLLDSLRTTMQNVKHDLNWQPRDTVRLIFHAFKVFKNAEAEAVKQVMSELGDYNVEFAFVHVAQDHPFLLFDKSKKDGIGYYKKGRLSPERGQYVQLTRRIMLVMLTGGAELKQPTDGLPTPVQLILHKDSTFKDLTYLAKQVVNFAAHSWRSFQPAPMPVTVFYSQLVAQMLGQLSSVPQWNPDAILNRIGTTRWFL